MAIQPLDRILIVEDEPSQHEQIKPNKIKIIARLLYYNIINVYY